MPTLGRASRGRRVGPMVAVSVVVALGLGAWRWRRHASAPPPATAPVRPAQAQSADSGAAQNVATAAAGPTTDAAADGAKSPTAASGAKSPTTPDGAKSPTAPDAAKSPSRPSTDELLARAGLRRAHAVIEGPLETALVADVGREVGLPLVQVVVRALVWWVDVPGGLRKGDEVDVLYEPRSGEEPQVAALRFKSEKLGHVFTAYRYRAGTGPARLYLPDGGELELRLENGPLDDYEQVTSLLRDGRNHQGVDFKTPVGTPVKAPFDGTIERRNWKTRDNGNSLELVESGGKHRTAIFLHLSKLADGNQVTRGQVIAWSGNTGHSFAPHLHYQLMSSSGQLLDPFASHATTRRTLPPSEMATFSAEVHHLDELMERPRR